MKRALETAERETLAEAKREADALSRGTYSTAQLRAMGHPYAKRRPRPPQDLAIINFQKGAFAGNWTAGQEWRGWRLRSTLRNRGKIPGYLSRGTHRMIARPIAKRIRERVEKPRRLARLKAALIRVFTP